MIYLDNGATSFYKPIQVERAMLQALHSCASPGRGGYQQSLNAAKTVFACRKRASELFDCEPEQVVFTANCTHALNLAIRSLVKPQSHVVISGFEHNAVTRPLHAIGARITVVGRILFNWESLLSEFERVLQSGVDAAIFTHVSNVFGYILPVYEMAKLCRQYGVPFIIDAAQSAGMLPISLRKLEADYIAMPGHKGLLGPQGTGILLCGSVPDPLIFGGTGGDSISQFMPEVTPERAEAGTINVPGIAGLSAGLSYLMQIGITSIEKKKRMETEYCTGLLQNNGFTVFTGEHHCGTVSFVSSIDCELIAQKLAEKGICVRAGLHCAPLAHESAGTIDSGTVRVSFGLDNSNYHTDALIRELKRLIKNF